MADEVEISNVGGDGGVASEATLASLTRAIEKLAASTGKDPTKEAGKVQKQYNDAVKSGVTVSTKNRDAIKKGTEATNKATKATTNYARALVGAASGVLGSVVGGFKGMATELLNGKNELSDFAKHIPLVGGPLSILTGIIDTNISSFRSLSEVGASFGNGLTDIRATAAAAGMPLQEFVEIVGQNSETMKLFGADTAAGARNFATMARELRSGPGKQLMNLGFTSGDLNQLLLDYAEIQNVAFTRDRQQGRVTAANAAAFGEEMQKLTAITGKQRDQIAASLKQQSGDIRMRAAAARMTAEESDRFRLNIADVGTESQAFANALTDYSDGIASDDVTRRLMQMSGTFQQFGDDVQNMDPGEFNNFVVGVRGDLEEYARANGMTLQELQNSIPGMAEAFGIVGETARRQMLSPAEIADMERRQKQEASNGQALKQFGETMNRLLADLTSAFINSGVLDLIQDKAEDLAAMLQNFVQSEAFTKTINNAAEKVKKFIDTWEQFDLKTALFGDSSKGIEGLIPPDFFPNIGDIIGSGLKAALTSPTVLAGIAALFVAPKILSAFSGGLGSLFGGGNDRGSRRSGGGGSGGGAGRAGAGIGNFIGQMGAGVMKGAAAGLKAFANPAILVGAGILAGAITAIGAGIAGATWLMGKALPTLAEGLESFENLDGAALVQAGKGMGAVALGLAAFGAGSAVAGLGNLVGNIADGIGSLFGGKSPLEKLEEFQKYSFNTDRIEGNAKALVAYSKAMAAYGAGGAAGSIGGLVSSIADGIASFFGGDKTLPFDDLVEFQKYNLNPEKVESNARALVAYSKAMAVAAGGGALSSIGGAVSAVADAITGFFGGDTTMPWEDVKAFAAADLGDSEKLRANSEAVAAFGAAMENMPEVKAERSGGLFDAVATIFSGTKDYPWDMVKLFSEADLGDTASVIANAEAMSAFGRALGDVPEINAERSGGLFSAVGTIFSGTKDYPWDMVKIFSEADLGDTAKVIANAEAMSAFGRALGDVPEIKAERSGGVFDLVSTIFSGTRDYPWDMVKLFADADLGDNAKIQSNAEAVSLFGSAMANMPEVNVERSGGVFDLVSTIFGGTRDYPWDMVKLFGDTVIDGAKVATNAEAMSAFGRAMSDMPEVNVERSGGVFDLVSTIFGGTKDYPWDMVKTFGDTAIDGTKVATNAAAVAAFGRAMANMPEVDVERSGGVFGAIATLFSGTKDYPWDTVKLFADADLGDPTAVTTNAMSLTAFSNALKTFDSSGMQNFDPGQLDELPGILEDFASIPGGGLAGIASGMTAIANIQDLQTNLDILKQGLDKEGVVSYTNAMNNLVETLEKLNEVLAEDNDGGLFGGGTGVSASDVLGQINTSSAGSAEGMNRLNSLMGQMLGILQEIASDADQIEKNTASSGSNVASGRVTYIRG